ncbi:hypothetical protein [Methanosarcina sp.]
MNDQNGKLLFSEGAMRDINGIKKAEEEKKAANKNGW